ncbi:hypothetical protein [Sphaerisporangium aureirubrum]|uniref:WXG100 family type VII secretion target n=1 Tax=Sphaerisporangium aureirubrum TaxID=1544736 RepID=A0ABW1NJR3_9ACTN
MSKSRVAGAGEDFRREHTTLSRALSDAAAALAALGDFWGNDEHGQLFHGGGAGRKGYRDASAEAAEHGGTIATAYARIGDNLERMGTNLQVAEWATIGALAHAVSDAGLAVPVTKAVTE